MILLGLFVYIVSLFIPLFCQFQHPRQRTNRPLPHRLIHLHFLFRIFQRPQYAVQMNLLHIRAKLTVTYGEKLLLRVLLQQFIEHAHLGADQEDFLIRIRRIINNLGGTSDKICQLQHIAGTLGCASTTASGCSSFAFFTSSA